MKAAPLLTALLAGVALAYPGMDLKKLMADVAGTPAPAPAPDATMPDPDTHRGGRGGRGGGRGGGGGGDRGGGDRGGDRGGGGRGGGGGGGGPSTELIGDLLTLENRELSPTGTDIKAILVGQAPGQDFRASYDGEELPPKNSPECGQDECCIWKYIADDMNQQMVGDAGRCNSIARGAIRLGFHDAAAWSKNSGGTGADGSIILANECKTRDENKGLEQICDVMEGWYKKYRKYRVTMADMIQMAANVATVSCPLGPRVRTFVGRRDTTNPAPENLIPSPFDSSDALFKLFAEKSFTPDGLAALLGAHSTSQQRFVDPRRAGAPQDSTPGTWDIAFYQQTLNPNAPAAVFKFQSDINVSTDPRTAEVWKMFADGRRGQFEWNEAYAAEYVRMSLLGVPNINDLTECTKSLPPFRKEFEQPDQDILDKIMSAVIDSPIVQDALEKGNKLTSSLLSLH